jgi:hypothetical protein
LTYAFEDHALVLQVIPIDKDFWILIADGEEFCSYLAGGARG